MGRTEQKLITRLIKDDLTNYRLVMGLENLGLVPEQYFLNVSEVIFELMGLKEEIDKNAVYGLYEKKKKEVLKYRLTKPEKLDEVADSIYRELKSYRLLHTSKQRRKQQLKQSI